MSRSKEFRVELILKVYNFDRSNHMTASKEVVLPFVPQVGMRFEDKDMYPVTFTTVTWSLEDYCFRCAVEWEGQCDFHLGDDVNELAGVLDILRDARKCGWIGFDRIYRDG